MQQVTPTLGTKQLVPESSTGGKAIAPSQRTPIVARAGGGVYVAYCSGYPTCTRVLVWKVGSTTPDGDRERHRHRGGHDVDDP